MHPTDDPSQPPPAPDELDHDDASRSTELPRVTLGSHSKSAPLSSQARVLRGRLPHRLFSTPILISTLTSALLTITFSLTTGEWHTPVILAAWALLLIWQWLYTEAYLYRRSLLKTLSALTSISLSCFLAAICYDRAPAQSAIQHSELVAREAHASLYISALLLAASAILLLAHWLWFGRGFRKKTITKPKTSP